MLDKISRIKDITIDGEYYSINLKNNIGFLLNKKYKYEPKIGDKIRLYKVDGSGIRGIDVNGKKIFYKPNGQLKREREELLKESTGRCMV